MTDQDRLDLILDALAGIDIPSERWSTKVRIENRQIMTDDIVLEPLPSLEEARELLVSAVVRLEEVPLEVAVLFEQEFGR